jgi:hypothetical protein
MKRAVGLVGALVLLAVPARAGEGLGISVGYSFLHYLETNGGNVPLGFYLSFSGRGKSAIELDLGYHHDTGTLTEGDVVFETKLDSFTALLGPRFSGGGSGRYGQRPTARPYFHILGGLRRDRLSVVHGNSTWTTSWGGMTGLGVDLPLGSALSLRLAADFQIFWDNGQDLKTLRFSGGFTF